MTKQLTIKGAYRRKAAHSTQSDELCDTLESEIEELEQLLLQKQAELAEAEIEHNDPPQRKKDCETGASYPQGQERQRRELEEACWRQRLVLGAEVVEHKTDELCCITYTMQHDSHKPVQHGLRIDMDSGRNFITKYALPVGFSLERVTSEYDNVMHPDCLTAVWRALVAYYNRQEQYQALTEVIKSNRSEVKWFTLPDYSHVELRLLLSRSGCRGTVEAALDLDYDTTAVRAGKLTLNADVLDEEFAELSDQCSVFKEKPMDVAFKKCFLEANKPWQCVGIRYDLDEEIADDPVEDSRRARRPSPPHVRRPRPTRHATGSDDETWLPDDISPR